MRDFQVVAVCCIVSISAFFFLYPPKESGLETVASELKKLKRELLVLDVFCEVSSRRDIRVLRETASKLDSPGAHASDQLSLYSSTAGLAGGALVLAGSIPTPFSPALLYLGGYITTAAFVGHVGNVLIAEEPYDFYEVRNVLENVAEFYEVMHSLENAYNALLKLEPEAILRGKNGRTLSEAELHNILFKIERLSNTKRDMEKKREITMSDANKFAEFMYDLLDYVHNAQGEDSAALSQEALGARETAVGLPKQVYSVSKFMRALSYRSSGKRVITAAALQSGSQSLLTSSAMKTAFVGVSSLFSVVTEAKNIEEVSRKIQDRKDFVYFLRDLADDMEKVCNGSPYCVT